MKINNFYTWKPSEPNREVQLYSVNFSSSVGVLRPGESFLVENIEKVKDKTDSNYDILVVRIKLGAFSYRQANYLLIQQKDFNQNEFNKLEVSGCMFS
jgi:hypothetical protein